MGSRPYQLPAPMSPNDISVVWLLWAVSCPLGCLPHLKGKADRPSAMRHLASALELALSLLSLNATCCPHTLSKEVVGSKTPALMSLWG